jgi:dienelactone hydrolase
VPVATLESWTLAEHRSADGTTKPTYQKGNGPGIVLIHELPGITPEVVDVAEELVTAGYTVVMPVLFGTPGRRMSPVSLAGSLAKVCTSAEFTKLATGRTAPVTDWLRSLARALHAELGGPGVGALGMCFTGGYALAMMVDDAVAAPVLAQPAAPFAIGKRRAADLGLSPADRDAVVARARAGCPVLGIRYVEDKAIGTRFETLHQLLGERFLAVDLPGRGHATLTLDRSQVAVDRVVAFFGERLPA